MGLSSNIIWHQTDLEGFKAILRQKCLKCSYSLEVYLNANSGLAFPMISLSDIPLADIDEYLNQYGGYLLGFSRRWVQDNGFNPVWYCEKNNQAIKAHKEALIKMYDESKDSFKETKLFALYASFIKDVEGPLYVKSTKQKYSNYRFYDEREYRFVPDFDELMKEGISPVLSRKLYDEYKNRQGDSLIEKTVGFTLADIEIIIVKTKKQVEDCRRRLYKMDPQNSIHVFSHDEIKQNVIGMWHQVLKESM